MRDTRKHVKSESHPKIETAPKDPKYCDGKIEKLGVVSFIRKAKCLKNTARAVLGPTYVASPEEGIVFSCGIVFLYRSTIMFD